MHFARHVVWVPCDRQMPGDVGASGPSQECTLPSVPGSHEVSRHTGVGSLGPPVKYDVLHSAVLLAILRHSASVVHAEVFVATDKRLREVVALLGVSLAPPSLGPGELF